MKVAEFEALVTYQYPVFGPAVTWAGWNVNGWLRQKRPT
jgi:hypothetical protein